MCRQCFSIVVTPPPFILPCAPFTRTQPPEPQNPTKTNIYFGVKIETICYDLAMPDTSQTLTDNQKLAADIREAMVILAKGIRKFGDAPWPLMERFQRELKAIEDREALLDDLLGQGSESANQTGAEQAQGQNVIRLQLKHRGS